MKISDKVALVSGGASGIGKVVSSKLLQNGAKLVAILDLDAESGQKTVSEFSEKFGAERVKFIQCDVTQEDQLKSIVGGAIRGACGFIFQCLYLGEQSTDSFQEAFNVCGSLDIVLNNAGILSQNNRKTIDVNLMAVINATFIAEKLMTKEKRSEKGIIINTASMAGLFTAGYIVNASYVASKYGVVGFTKSLLDSTDAFNKDLRVVAICPAIIETNLWDGCNFQTKEVKERLGAYKADNKVISLDMAVDAFMLAIEDENLHGAIITVTNATGIAIQDW